MLHRDRAVLVVVDVQNRLLPSIDRGLEVVREVVRAIRGFQLVGAPVIVTEQYRRGLGATHPAIQEAILSPPPADGDPGANDATPPGDAFAARPGFEPLEKMTFSCAADAAFLERLASVGRRQVVLAGVEAHVCVLQTALHLVDREYETYVLADAVSSRTARNREIALARMAQEGVRHASVEMAIFEMLHVSGTDEFRAWSRLIR